MNFWLKEIYNTVCCQCEVYQIIPTYCIENVCLRGEVKNKRIIKMMYRRIYRQIIITKFKEILC